MKTVDVMKKGLIHARNSLMQLENVYHDLLSYAESNAVSSPIVKVTDKILLEHALHVFGPQMDPAHLKCAIEDLYELAVHRNTGAIIIASLPYIIAAKTVYRKQIFNSHCQSVTVYMPESGVELVNVSRVGEITNQPYVLRSESACTPSFLFGSEACNCASQWRSTQELAAYFNADDRSLHDAVGFLMIHLESQNGMGVGFSEDTFAIDLAARAQLRHAALLVLSQKHHLSIHETFNAIGISHDPRRAAGGAGYKITPVVLDYLNTNHEPILLSNNPMKIQILKDFGYSPKRLKLLGEITAASKREAKARSQLGHLDIGTESATIESEFHRLKLQIQSTFNNRETLC